MSDDDLDSISREQSPCSDSPRPALLDIDNPLDMCTSVSTSTIRNPSSTKPHMKVCKAPSLTILMCLNFFYIINNTLNL